MKLVPLTREELLEEHAKRLNAVMTELGVNAYGLSKSLKYKEPTTVYHIVKKRNLMSLKFIDRLVKKYPHISYLFLKDGKGDITLDIKGTIAQNNLLGIDTIENAKEDMILESLELAHKKLDMILNKLKL